MMMKKRLTADEVIRRAGLVDDRFYMHVDSGAVDSGAGWNQTLREVERSGAEFDSAFDPDGDGAHLVEVVKSTDGSWIEA